MVTECFGWLDLPKYADQVLCEDNSHYLCHKRYPDRYFSITKPHHRKAVTNNTIHELSIAVLSMHFDVSVSIFHKDDKGWYIHTPPTFDKKGNRIINKGTV